MQGWPMGLHSDTPEEDFPLFRSGLLALWDNRRCSGGSRSLFGLARFAA